MCPDPNATLLRLLLGLVELIFAGGVWRVSHSSGISRPDHLFVYKCTVSEEYVTQQAFETVSGRDVLDQGDHHPLHQRGIFIAGFSPKWLPSFGCIHADITHGERFSIDLHIDSVPIDNLGDQPLFELRILQGTAGDIYDHWSRLGCWYRGWHLG